MLDIEESLFGSRKAYNYLEAAFVLELVKINAMAVEEFRHVRELNIQPRLYWMGNDVCEVQ